MPHQPTQIIVHILTELVRECAWMSTSDLAELLPTVGRPTFVRVLDELYKRCWVTKRSHQGADFWLAGPELLTMGEEWREQRTQEAEALIHLLHCQVSWPTDSRPGAPTEPPFLTLAPIRPACAPAHQGVSTACDVLEGMSRHGGWITATDLAQALEIHRQTAQEILTTLGAHGWAGSDPQGNWTLSVLFPTLCLRPTLKAAGRAWSGQEVLTLQINAQILRAQ